MLSRAVSTGSPVEATMAPAGDLELSPTKALSAPLQSATQLAPTTAQALLQVRPLHPGQEEHPAAEAALVPPQALQVYWTTVLQLLQLCYLTAHKFWQCPRAGSEEVPISPP